jgi:peptidoglycan/LPS O-acetylase OafA/YrhL
MVYGASAPFYYAEPPFTDPIAFQVFLIFALLNQAWFMGAFFLLAGYFTPGSYDRKGAGEFLTGRILRLGIPILLFYFVLGPISSIGFYLMPAELTGITTPPSFQAYPGLVGLGPLWFVAMLLVFNIGYAVWRMATQRWAPTTHEPSRPNILVIVAFILLLAGASYLMRQVVPLGQEVLDFPTLAYLPQYLSFFVVGAVASRRDWFRTLPGWMGVVGFVLAMAAVVALFPLAFSGQWFSVEITPALDNAMGNGHWQSAVYALFDSTFAVGLCLGLIVLFRGLFNKENKIGTFLSRQSYAVYIVHIPIVVFLAYAMRGIELAPLLKFGLASLIIVPVCFIVAAIARKIPFASRTI